MQEVSLIVQLVRIAIGRQNSLDHVPSEEEWSDVVKSSKKQSLVGVCCSGMMRLPKEQMPGMGIKVRMGFLADSIRERNTLINSRIVQLNGWLNDMGLDTCLLKGQGMARLYPDSGMRTPGDIDMWVNADVRTAIRNIRARWRVGRVFYHHTEIRPFEDKIAVEIHFTPTWMNSFPADRRLQNFFMRCAFEQFGRNECDDGFVICSVGFDCVFSAVHILRHLLAEGIGMKQILDYYFILLNSSEDERQMAFKMLHSLKLDRFIGALMYVEKSLFLLDDTYLLCPPDSLWGTFFLNEIFIAGNFGQYDSRYKYNSNDRLLKRAVSRMSRLVRYFGIAPTEVLWAPVFKAWQHLWRFWIKITL